MSRPSPFELSDKLRDEHGLDFYVEYLLEHSNNTSMTIDIVIDVRGTPWELLESSRIQILCDQVFAYVKQKIDEYNIICVYFWKEGYKASLVGYSIHDDDWWDPAFAEVDEKLLPTLLEKYKNEHP